MLPKVPTSTKTTVYLFFMKVSLLIIAFLFSIQSFVWASDGQDSVQAKDSVLYWVNLADNPSFLYSQRLAYAQNALKLAQKKQNKTGTAKALTSLGTIALEQDDYQQALDYLQQANLIAKQTAQLKPLSQTSYLIGNVHNYLNAPHEALKYYQQAQRLYLQRKDSVGLGMVYNSLGIVYSRLDQADKALDYYQQSLFLLEQLKEEHYKTYPLNNLGDYYFHQGEYERALLNFQEALQIDRRYEDLKGESVSLGNIAWIYREMGELEKATNTLKQALNIAIPEGYDKVVYDLQKDLSETYEQMGNYERALYYHQSYTELKDSVLGEKTQECIAQLQVRFETKQTQQALQAAQQDVGSLRQQEVRNRWKTYTIAIALIAVILISLFIVWRMNERIKEKRALIEKNKQLHQMEQQLMESELKNKELKNVQLKEELAYKNKDLTNFALDIARKNEFANKILNGLETVALVKGNAQKKKLHELTQFAKSHLKINEDLESFQMNIEKVNQDFFDGLNKRYPDLTPNERHLSGLIRLNLTTKDIAAMRNISPKTVEMARYRLRKKLALDPSEELNLFLQQL